MEGEKQQEERQLIIGLKHFSYFCSDLSGLFGCCCLFHSFSQLVFIIAISEFTFALFCVSQFVLKTKLSLLSVFTWWSYIDGAVYRSSCTKKPTKFLFIALKFEEQWGFPLQYLHFLLCHQQAVRFYFKQRFNRDRSPMILWMSFSALVCVTYWSLHGKAFLFVFSACHRRMLWTII